MQAKFHACFDYTAEMRREMKVLLRISNFVAVLVGAFGVSGNVTFPTNFMLGAATGAYQIEGAWNVNGELMCGGAYAVTSMLTETGS